MDPFEENAKYFNLVNWQFTLWCHLQHNLGLDPEPRLPILPLRQLQVVAHVLYGPLLELDPLDGLAEVGAEDVLVKVEPELDSESAQYYVGMGYFYDHIA